MNNSFFEIGFWTLLAGVWIFAVIILISWWRAGTILRRDSRPPVKTEWGKTVGEVLSAERDKTGLRVTMRIDDPRVADLIRGDVGGFSLMKEDDD